MYMKIPSNTDCWNYTVCILARTTATMKTNPVNCKINSLIHLVWFLSNVQPYNPPIPVTEDAGQ